MDKHGHREEVSLDQLANPDHSDILSPYQPTGRKSWVASHTIPRMTATVASSTKLVSFESTTRHRITLVADAIRSQNKSFQTHFLHAPKSSTAFWCILLIQQKGKRHATFGCARRTSSNLDRAQSKLFVATLDWSNCSEHGHDEKRTNFSVDWRCRSNTVEPC